MTYMSIGLAQRAIGFLLLPFYARVLTPEDYGAVALLLAVFGAAQFLLSFGLEVAVFRGYFLHSSDPQERDSYINTLGLFLFVAPVTLAAFLSIPIVAFAGRTVIPLDLVVLELVSASVYIAATVVPLGVIRARESLSDYVKINGSFAVAQLVLKGVLVLGMGLGVRGWVLSDLCSAIVMMCVSMSVLGHKWTLQFESRHIRPALVLGLPLLPHLLSHWVLSLSDRFVLGAILDARQVGLYSMGYQFGILMGIALGETNRAMLPVYGRAISSEADRASLAKTATLQILFAGVLGCAVALLAPPIIGLLLPRAYLPSAGVVPAVALGYVFYGWYYIPMNAASIINGDTRFVAIPTVCAAGLNVGLNVWLVPKFGIVVAGINTAVSYGVLLILVSLYKHLRIAWRFNFDWVRLILSLLAIASVYTLTEHFTSTEGIPSAIFRSSAVGALTWGLYLMHRGLIGQTPATVATTPTRGTLAQREDRT